MKPEDGSGASAAGPAGRAAPPRLAALKQALAASLGVSRPDDWREWLVGLLLRPDPQAADRPAPRTAEALELQAQRLPRRPPGRGIRRQPLVDGRGRVLERSAGPVGALSAEAAPRPPLPPAEPRSPRAAAGPWPRLLQRIAGAARDRLRRWIAPLERGQPDDRSHIRPGITQMGTVPMALEGTLPVALDGGATGASFTTSSAASATAALPSRPDRLDPARPAVAEAPAPGLLRGVARVLQEMFAERVAELLEALLALPVWRRPALRLVLGAAGAGGLLLVAVTPLEPGRQLLFGAAVLLAALGLRRVAGPLPGLLMVALAALASGRYLWWRLSTTLQGDADLGALLGVGLLLAELYAALVMALGFLQALHPLRRRSLPITLPREQWPHVDVYIPSYDEPIEVVRPTLLAARDLDWPAERLHVHLLDDGDRPELRELAARLGVGYLARQDHRHAKAGNLNHALAHTRGEFVAVFDCDHIPQRHFLIRTMGQLLADARCALVQTPHHFFSPDPFERNLGTFRRVPNEGGLFYGLVQDGNDTWNACYFCGSCAVLRRAALDEIGGIATDTVTEDAHTALRLHRRGWRSAYLNEVLAGGLATESLAGHVKQRMRWARGMAQIFRLDNPLLGRGLGWMQRLCYANAMLHFFYGLPRLVFLTSPLAYLFFGLEVIRADALLLLIYLLPHLALPALANTHLAGPHRHSFWSELYETVLAWYVLGPTTLALLAPRRGRFDVTAKGGLVERTRLDWRIARPFAVLVVLNAAGFFAGLVQSLADGEQRATALLNTAWTAYNLVTLGAALGVARERRQVRRSTRVSDALPADLLLSDGRQFDTCTIDYGLGGLSLAGPGAAAGLRAGDWVAVRLVEGDSGVRRLFPMRVVEVQDERTALRFESLGLDQQAALLRCTFSRPGAWDRWARAASPDRALLGLGEVLRLGLGSYLVLARDGLAALAVRRREREQEREQALARIEMARRSPRARPGVAAGGASR